MNLLEVGGLLKRERERRRLSLRDVMEATKISRRNLNALEAGEVKLLPHPVYLKGYVRNYARLVGLDPEPLVAAVDLQSDGDSGYLPQTAPPAVSEADAPVPATEPAADVSAGAVPLVAEPVLAAPAASGEPAQQESEPEQAESFASQIRFPRPGESMSKPRRRLWPWVALVLLLVALGFAYVQYLRIQAAIDEALPKIVEVAPLAENATNATTEANATEPEANATLARQEPIPALVAAPAPVPETKAEPAPKPAAPATGPATSLPPVPASKPATPAVAAPSIEVTRKAPAQTPEPRTPGMQELVVTAKPGETCWVEVSEGQQKKSFTLKDGESRRFEFSNKARVRLGNAGGVSFQVNGAYYPHEGERGQTATVDIGAR